MARLMPSLMTMAAMGSIMGRRRRPARRLPQLERRERRPALSVERGRIKPLSGVRQLPEANRLLGFAGNAFRSGNRFQRRTGFPPRSSAETGRVLAPVARAANSLFRLRAQAELARRAVAASRLPSSRLVAPAETRIRAAFAASLSRQPRALPASVGSRQMILGAFARSRAARIPPRSPLQGFAGLLGFRI